MVSVCIATYNGEGYIKEQLDSILCQIAEDDEIIICDDVSIDNTTAILYSYNDERIKVYINHTRLGIVKNFEKALTFAKGQYIFLADQDDIWKLGKVKLCIDLLQDYYLVMSDCILVNENAEILHPSFFKMHNSKKGLLNNIIKNNFIGSCMAFRSEVLAKSLPFPPKVAMHDWWIGLIVSLNYNCIFFDEPLVLHRIHSHNSSSTGSLSKNSFWKKLLIRASMIEALLKNNFRFIGK